MADLKNEELFNYYLEKRIVYIYGEITWVAHFKYVEAFESLAFKSKEKIRCKLNTPGGSVRATLNIVDCLFSLKKEIPFTCLVQGECSSAGLTLLAAFQKETRFATRHSHFFFHGMVYSPDFVLTKDKEKQFAAASKEFDCLNTVMLIQEKGFGLKEKELLELRTRGEECAKMYTSISADDAVQLGLVCAIKDSINEI